MYKRQVLIVPLELMYAALIALALVQREAEQASVRAHARRHRGTVGQAGLEPATDGL